MFAIGNSLKDLVCLQIRSCEGITDEGIIQFSEALSGYTKYKESAKSPSIHEHQSESKLEHLNVANDRVLTDKAIAAVASHLLQNLKDFCFVYHFSARFYTRQNSMDAIK